MIDLFSNTKNHSSVEQTPIGNYYVEEKNAD